jgi:hypothetical protein
MAEASRPVQVDPELLVGCNTFLDAIHRCIHLSHLPNYVIAQKLGIDKSHWTRMMQAQAHFPTNKMQALMELCGNYAPLQWLAMNCGFEIKENDKAQKIARLERELAALKAA